MIAIIQTLIISIITSLTLLTLSAQVKSILEMKWQIDAETYKHSLEQEREYKCR